MTAKHTEPSENRCQLRFADGRRCALPAHPQGDGLCYPHAHAPHRRLRPSDLTRELASPSGAVVPDAKIYRLIAKLPAAVADGTISTSEARVLKHLCYVMLQCSRLGHPTKDVRPEPVEGLSSYVPSFFPGHDPDWNFVASLLNEDD